EADAIQKAIVTGTDGNDTLILDHANGRVHFDEGIQFDGGGGTNTQQEINDQALSSGIVAKIKNGLSELAEWGKKLADFAEVAQKLPGLGMSIADTLGVGDGSLPIAGAIKQGLVDPLNSYLSTASSPTVQNLVDVLRSLSGPLGKVSFQINPFSVTGGQFT